MNITGHQARTEPKDYAGIATCNRHQRKERKQTQRNTEQLSDLLWWYFQGFEIGIPQIWVEICFKTLVGSELNSCFSLCEKGKHCSTRTKSCTTHLSSLFYMQGTTSSCLHNKHSLTHAHTHTKKQENSQACTHKHTLTHPHSPSEHCCERKH